MKGEGGCNKEGEWRELEARCLCGHAALLPFLACPSLFFSPTRQGQPWARERAGKQGNRVQGGGEAAGKREAMRVRFTLLLAFFAECASLIPCFRKKVGK